LVGSETKSARRLVSGQELGSQRESG